LVGKVAVVVGGGSTGSYPGTGSAISRLFAAQGAKVAVIGRSAAHTQSTVDVIVAGGDEAAAFLGDASVPSECERLVDEVATHFGGIDVLVNNLGAIDGASPADITEETWLHVIATNLGSVTFMSKFASPYMTRRGGGSIVNIGSVAGLESSGNVGYSTTKGALITLTRDLAAALGRSGIRANCIVVGRIHTPLAAADEEMRELRRELTMLGTEGTAWDVAWAACFFAGDESAYVTATALPVDGGSSGLSRFSTALRLRSRLD
jgi:NAD(P)-dependent dehydrogenase (short-subunit alcohol dehydrogenase family)